MMCLESFEEVLAKLQAIHVGKLYVSVKFKSSCIIIVCKVESNNKI